LGLDRMDGGAGIDSLDVRFWNGAYVLNMNTGVTNYAGETATNFENVFTGAGNDTITGTAGNNVISTGAGNDRVFAGAGNDTIYGGPGNDVLRGQNGNDRIFGQAGNDWIDGGLGLDRMDGGAGIDTLDVRFWNGAYNLNMITGVTNYVGETATNFERVYTGAGNDIITGTAGANYIHTGAGNDSVFAGAGNDTVVGGLGNDVLRGEAGNDYLLGDRGNDILVGGLGNDRLNGTTLTAEGTGERDILFSGNTNDTDVFVLGQNGRVFYNDQGNTDHAVLRDFDAYNFVGDIADRIQLVGSAASYSLSNVSVNGVAGAGISFGGDLIGIVQGVNAASLNLANTNQFTYV
ncbi:calcium-binding protein, partial [Adonisia turfae]